MGASEFRNTIKSTSASAAYKSLVKDATDEYGSDPYNGTISTTSGFIEVFPNAGESVDSCIERMLGDDGARLGIEKYEKAGCINLANGKFVFFGWASC